MARRSRKRTLAFSTITLVISTMALLLAAATAGAAERPFFQALSPVTTFSEPDAPFVRTRNAQLAFNPLEGITPSGTPALRQGERLRLYFFDAGGAPFQIVSVTIHRSGTVTWQGRFVDGAGFGIISAKGDGFTGYFQRAAQTVLVRATGGGELSIAEVNPRAALAPPPGGNDALTVHEAPAPARSPNSPQDDGSVVDVLVLYTPLARADAGGTTQIETEIETIVALTNQAYENSGITTRLRLAHIAEVQVDETNYPNSQTLFYALMNPTDGVMDEIHPLRDQVNADVVSLLFGAYPTTYAGVGALGGAFSIASRGGALTAFVFSHEIGHNFGAHHEWRQYPVSTPRYEFNHGYTYTATGQTGFVTIMSYGVGCNEEYPCARIANFSNPDVLYQGVPTGIPEGEPFPADNRKTHNYNASRVANFRVSDNACVQPYAPWLDTPLDEAEIIVANGAVATVQFWWGSYGGPNRYQFQIAADVAFTQILVDKTQEPPLTTEQLPPGMYYWRAKGVNDLNGCQLESVWSEIRTLTVMRHTVYLPIIRK